MFLPVGVKSANKEISNINVSIWIWLKMSKVLLSCFNGQGFKIAVVKNYVSLI